MASFERAERPPREEEALVLPTTVKALRRDTGLHGVPRTAGPSRLRFVFAQLSLYRRRAAVLTALLVCNVALVTVNPRLFSWAVADYVQPGDTSRAIYGAGASVGVAVLNFGVSVIAGRLAISLAQRITNTIRLRLIGKLLDRQRAFIESHSVGELVERIDGDTATLERTFAELVFDVAATVLLICGVLIASLLASFWIGCVVVVAMLVGLVGILFAQRRSRHLLEGERRAKARLRGRLQEFLDARDEIRTAAAENYVLRQLERILSRLRLAMAHAGPAARASSAALEISIATASAAVLAVGGALLGLGVATVVQVFLVTQYVALLSTAMSRLSLRLFDLSSASGSVERIMAILALPTRPAERTTTGRAEPSIEFDHVNFAYTDLNVLDDVSFKLREGESLAVIGRSGSGKSTIASLTWGAFSPSSGVVRVAGVCVEELATLELRRLIGVVTQDIHIFDATLRDNVTMFDDRVPDDAVEDVLDRLGLTVWRQSLPRGVSTRLAESGVETSLGQRQLIGIARVLIRNPPIVVLDEITAHVDGLTEELVNTAISTLIQGRTAIVITHNEAFLRRVSQVLILDDGKVVWRGTPGELPQSVSRDIVKKG